MTEGESDLRFDVSVENAISVHVVDALEHLVHVVLDALLGQVVPAPLYRLVHVHVHQFEYQRQPASRFIATNKGKQ